MNIHLSKNKSIISILKISSLSTYVKKILLTLSAFLSFIPLTSLGQEFLLIDKTFTWTETTGGDGCFGFHFWNDKGASPTDNWKSPFDYQNGLFYFRYEIISQPQISPGVYEPFDISFCIWADRNFQPGKWKETCSDLHHFTGPGSAKVFIESPSTWWNHPNGGIDWAHLEKLWRFGNPFWYLNDVLASSGCSNSPQNWSQRGRFFPLTLRMTIVAVAQGQTFSGWNNYIGGTKHPLPTYTVDFMNELTNKTVPSTDEYSFNLNMTGATNGNGQKLILTPGQNVYFRTKASGNLLASDIQTLSVPSRPLAPVFTIDLINNRTSEVVSNAYEYSDNSNMSGAITGTGNYVVINPGATKYFRKKATGSAFNSAIQTLNAPSFTGNVKIIPVGNSLTYDDFSGDSRPAGLRTGYRQPLWLKLSESGFNVDFVGSRTAGQNAVPSFDPHNEGWPGFRDDQVADSIYNWLTRNPADVVLLHIGTNSLDTSSADVRDILNEIDRYELDFNREVWVLLAAIINRAPISSTTSTFNSNVRSMAQQRINNQGDKILLVNMENEADLVYSIQPVGDMADQIHPNSVGYEKMARLWYRYLSSILPVSGTNPPPGPTNLISTGNTQSSITISWNDNSYSEFGFIIEQSSDSLTGYLTRDTVTTNTNSYIANSLSAASKYYFRTRSYNSIGNSAYSNIISVTTQSTPPVNDLTVYWPLDNSSADVSGNNHNLTLFNGAAFSTDHEVGSHSLSFDGVDDYAASDVVNPGNEFSILLWAKVNSSSNIKTLVANANSGASSNGFKLIVNTYGTSDRKIIFESGNGSSGNHTTSATGVFSFNTWNHVALVVNRSTGAATIYYNGNNVNAVSGVHTGFNNNAVIRLGRMTNNAFTLNGKLDDVRIYNRVLSQGEIQTIMSGGIPSPLNPPSALSASLSGNAVQLNWTDNSGNEDGFTLERTLSGGTFSAIHTAAVNQTSFLDNTVSEGNTYVYRIKAFNAGSQSDYSNTDTITVFTLPPDAPSNLTTSGITTNSVQLNWNDNSTTEDGFKIERSADSLSGYSEIDLLGANNTGFPDNGLTPGTKYYYRVRSYNSIGNSAYSNIASATTQSTPPANDLTALWHLDNTLSDASGNNHDLSVFNGATFSTDHQVGSHSLLFDGIDDYAASDQINLGNEFSILLWAKINSSSNIKTLVANANSGASSNGFKFDVNTYGTTDRKIIFESGNGLTGNHTTSATGVFSFNTWNHVALIVNRSTGVAAIYYNGSNVTSVSGVHTGFNNNAIIRLGRMANNLFALNGKLDDVRIYNRILTQTEIQDVISNFKGTLPGPVSESIYPNPFKDAIHIRGIDFSLLQVIDMSGRIRAVLNESDKSETINTEEFEPGIYLLKIIKKEGMVEIKKIIKTGF